MKGVILAGGLGTRLQPLTKITNKHLLPVYSAPMIYYPIRALVEAGIEDIMIVCGGNHAGEFLRLLGNGAEFGLKHLNYTYQQNEGGIAEALGLCEHFVDQDKVVVFLGDNIIESSIAEAVKEFDLVIGTTAKGATRSSNIIRQTITPEEAIRYIERSMNTALVLGRETIGLKNEELKECDVVVSIPTSTQYRTLNISHALAILLYVFLMRKRKYKEKNIPAKREREQLVSYVNSILDVIDFPKHRRLRVLKTFNKLLMEASPSKEEIVTMLGFFRRTWIRLSRS